MRKTKHAVGLIALLLAHESAKAVPWIEIVE